MKKILIGIAGLFFTSGFCFADSIMATPQATPIVSTTPVGTATSAASTGGFYLGLGTGLDLPGTNWDPTYYVGGFTNLFGGYGFDNNLALQLDLVQGIYTGNGTNLYNFRGLVDLKYAFSVVGWQPYLLGGLGVAYQSLSPVAATTTNFDWLLGAGFQFDLWPKTHLFVEAKYNFIMSQTTTFTDLPITAGLWLGF